MIVVLAPAAAGAARIAGLRNVRYWASDRLPIHYEMDSVGDPRIGDGSEYTAINQAFAAWTSIPSVAFSVTADPLIQGPSQAVAGDGHNSVTFSDVDGFIPGYLGQTVVTSVTADTVIAGRLFHAGEIVDADVLFNAASFSFSTPSFSGTAGAYDLRGIATHELGHFLGLAHSCIGTATMYWTIPHGTAFASLQDDDRALARRNYGSPAPPLSITGHILRSDGITPVPGAAVLAIAANGDTVQMTVSGEDGAYGFYGLANSCRVYTLPIDGGPEVGRLVARAVNEDVARIARTDFLAEFWDGASESNTDFGTTGVLVNAATFPVASADIVVNDDITPPHVVMVTPVANATDVPITVGISVKFDDRIDLTSISGQTVELRIAATGAPVDAGAGLLQRDSLLVVTPRAALLPTTTYRLTVGPGIKDRFGNISNDVFTVTFTTQLPPSLQLFAASPIEVPVGATLALLGTGFDAVPANNTVFFGSIPATAAASTVNRLYVNVPDIPDLAQGSPIDVHVAVGGSQSGTIPIRILPPRPTPIVNHIGDVTLSAEVRHVVVGPDARFAYVATASGIDVVGADPGIAAEFLHVTQIPIPGGCTGLVAMPDGKRVLAIGPSEPRLQAIDADPDSPLRNSVVRDTTLAEEPLGIETVPGGGEVLVVFRSRVALLDAGAQFGLELRQWADSTLAFQGELAVSLDATEAYATTSDGKIALLGLRADEGIVSQLLGGTEPREIAALPTGGGFLSVDASGTVRRAGAGGQMLQSLPVGGGYTGACVSPEGGFAYAANFTLNRVDIIDLQQAALTRVADFPVGIDPRDVTTGRAGRYVYVITGGSNRLEVFDTDGALRIDAISPQAGGTGTLVTIRGHGFNPVPGDNRVEIGGVAQTSVEASPDGTTLLVRQGPTAAQGGLRVSTGGKSSNAILYDVQNRPDPGRLGAGFAVPIFLSNPLSQLSMSSNGHLLLATDVSSALIAIQADPSAPNLNRTLQTLPAAQAHLISPRQMASTPDGKHLYIADQVTGIQVFDVDESATQVLQWNRTLPSPVDAPNFTSVALSPDGRTAYVVAAIYDSVFGYSTQTDSIVLRLWVRRPFEAAVHPNGHTLYVGATSPFGGRIEVFDIAAGAGPPAAVVGLPSGENFNSLVIRPDGRRMYASWFTSFPTANGVSEIDIDPGSPLVNVVLQSANLPGTSVPDLKVNHSGTLLYTRSAGAPYVAFSLQPTFAANIYTSVSSSDRNDIHVTAISQDDARLYVIASILGGIDPLPTPGIEVVSLTPGNLLQFESPLTLGAEVGQPLASPFVLRFGEGSPELVRGTPVQFNCAGGTFASGDHSFDTVADGTGRVRAGITAGNVLGTYVVNIATAGDSPEGQFVVGGDTTLATVSVVSVRPGPAGLASVNTSIAVDFSRALAPQSVNTASVFVRPTGGSALQVQLSLADLSRRVFLDPVAPLLPNTSYEVVVAPTVQDQGGNSVANPGTFGFATGDLPVLALQSITPPAGRPGDPLVLAGTGFAVRAEDNRVLFGSTVLTARKTPTGGLIVVVPYDAASAQIHVEVGPQVSNALPFQVLPPPTVPVTQIVGTIQVPSSGQRIAIVPDGTRAYMTSPGAGTVIPIVIADDRVEAAIGVGAYPFDIAASPSGREVYVSNFQSNDVSVIDSWPASPKFQTVIATIPVGRNPAGIAVSPDGKRLYVVNYGSSTFTTIDIDPDSQTRYTPIGGGDTGSPSQAIAVTPDGLRVIVGTATGIRIFNASDGRATANGTTAATTTSVRVTPDGGFVIVLASNGQLFLIDIRPASATENIATANGTTAATTTSVRVTPDGGFAYVTNSDGTVDVYRIVSLTSAGKANPTGSAAAVITHEFQIVARIPVGENPTAIDFDPTGSGRALVVNSGSNSVSIIGLPTSLPAHIDFAPSSLRLNPHQDNATVRLWFDPPVDVADLDVASVRLNGVVPVARDLGMDTGAGNGNGNSGAQRSVRVLRFDLQQVFATLPSQGQTALIVLTGKVGGRDFRGETTVRIRRPHVDSPRAGDRVTVGQPIAIRWTPVEGSHYVGIYIAYGGEHPPQIVVSQTPDDGDFSWVVQGPSSSKCRLWIVAYDAAREAIGTGSEEGDFVVRQPTDTQDAVPVRFALRATSPNPGRGETTFLLDLPAAAPVDFAVYAANGTLVRRLARAERYPAGRHVLRWNGENEAGIHAGSGVYFAVARAGAWSAREKIVRIR